MAEKFSIDIQKRPWWEWVIAALWLFAEVYIYQNAVNSAAELEPRAASIFWVAFFVLLVAGVVVWYLRRNDKM